MKKMIGILAVLLVLTTGAAAKNFTIQDSSANPLFKVDGNTGEKQLKNGLVNISEGGEPIARFEQSGIEFNQPLSLQAPGALSVANGIDLTGTSSNTIDSYSTLYLTTSSGSPSDIVLQPTGEVGVDSNLSTTGDIDLQGNALRGTGSLVDKNGNQCNANQFLNGNGVCQTDTDTDTTLTEDEAEQFIFDTGDNNQGNLGLNGNEIVDTQGSVTLGGGNVDVPDGGITVSGNTDGVDLDNPGNAITINSNQYEIASGSINDNEVSDNSLTSSSLSSGSVTASGSELDSSVAGNQLNLNSGTLDVTEGSGSGLNADQLDGNQASYFEEEGHGGEHSGAGLSNSGDSLSINAGNALAINSDNLDVASGGVADNEIADNTVDNSEIQNNANFDFNRVDVNGVGGGASTDGSVGIGAPSVYTSIVEAPNEKGGSSTYLELSSNGFHSSINNDNIGLVTQGSVQAMVDENGRFGIGTTSPQRSLDVNGDARIRGDLDVWGNIQNTDVDNLNVNGSISPPSGYDGTFDIGSNSRRWRDGYFSGTVYASNFQDTGSGQSISDTYVDESGDTMTGPLDMGGNEIQNVGSRGNYIEIGDPNNVNGISDSNFYGIDMAWDTDNAFIGLRDYGSDRKDVVISNEQTADNIRLQADGNDRLVAKGGGGVGINGGALDLNTNAITNADWSNANDLNSGGGISDFSNANDLNSGGTVTDFSNANDLNTGGTVVDFSNANDLDGNGNLQSNSVADNEISDNTVDNSEIQNSDRFTFNGIDSNGQINTAGNKQWDLIVENSNSRPHRGLLIESDADAGQNDTALEIRSDGSGGSVTEDHTMFLVDAGHETVGIGDFDEGATNNYPDHALDINSGDVSLSGNGQIENVQDPNEAQDVATKSYVDSSDNTGTDDQTLGEVLNQGNTASQAINMNGNNINGGGNFDISSISELNSDGSNLHLQHVTSSSRVEVGADSGSVTTDFNGNSIVNTGGFDYSSANDLNSGGTVVDFSNANDLDGNGNLQSNSVADNEISDNTVDNSEIQNGDSFTFGGITNNGDLNMQDNTINNVQSITTDGSRSQPNLVLHSTSNNDNWNDQGAYISLGESGSLGGAALHLTYIGNGDSYIGSGSVSGGIPSESRFKFDYDSKNIQTNSNLDINGQLSVDSTQCSSGQVILGDGSCGTAGSAHNKDLVAGSGLSGGANDVLVGSDSDVSLSLNANDLDSNGNINDFSAANDLNSNGDVVANYINLNNIESVNDGQIGRDNSIGYLGNWGGNGNAVLWDAYNVQEGNAISITGGTGNEDNPQIAVNEGGISHDNIGGVSYNDHHGLGDDLTWDGSNNPRLTSGTIDVDEIDFGEGKIISTQGSASGVQMDFEGSDNTLDFRDHQNDGEVWLQVQNNGPVKTPDTNLNLGNNNINNIGGLQNCGANEFVNGNGNCETDTDTNTDNQNLDQVLDQGNSAGNNNIDMNGNNITDNAKGNVTIGQDLKVYGDLWLPGDGSGGSGSTGGDLTEPLDVNGYNITNSSGGNVTINSDVKINGAIWQPKGTGGGVGGGGGAVTSDIDLNGSKIKDTADGNVTIEDELQVEGGKVWVDNADLAEMYGSRQELEAGEIVKISSSNDDSMERTEKKYDSAAGVVSTKPGYVLDSNRSGYPVALEGKAPVKVSERNGEIERGDRIVPSATEGVGIKCEIKPLDSAENFEEYREVSEHNRKCRDSTIGKALEKSEGKSKILVKITA